ncbi:unnamed protein product, partial [Rotaria socialis]
GDPTIESHEIEISSMKYRTHEINIGSLNSLENIARKYATSFNGIDDLIPGRTYTVVYDGKSPYLAVLHGSVLRSATLSHDPPRLTNGGDRFVLYDNEDPNHRMIILSSDDDLDCLSNSGNCEAHVSVLNCWCTFA